MIQIWYRFRLNDTDYVYEVFKQHNKVELNITCGFFQYSLALVCNDFLLKYLQCGYYKLWITVKMRYKTTTVSQIKSQISKYWHLAMKPLQSSASHWSEASKERINSRKTGGKKNKKKKVDLSSEGIKGTYFPPTLNEGWAPTYSPEDFLNAPRKNSIHILTIWHMEITLKLE